ncbi:MAG: hypothetical protein WBG92_03850 [Thiohalocapsa sp.]
MLPGSRLTLAAVLLPALLWVLPSAAAAEAPYVPDILSPWVDWVFGGQDQRACPLGSSGSGGEDGERVCAWPGQLRLDVDRLGGRFEQRWTLRAKTWVPLPGGDGQWPQQVSADAEALAVVEHDGRPAVRLGPGVHRLSGRFVWPRRPQLLALPTEIGLLSLRLDGAEVTNPRLDANGRLWLGGGNRASEAAEPDALTLEVTRRIDDDIPLRVRTRLTLDVSGQTRELFLGPVMLEAGIPLRVDSPLPARLIGSGDRTGDAADHQTSGTRSNRQSGSGRMLQIQLRPGRWELTLDSHHPGPVEALSLAAHPAPWPDQEVWVFAAHPDLRQVEITGAEAIDPRQTRLPADWQRLPAYLMRPGETLRLEQLRRGASGADRIRLDRELRLDFAGDAFSVRDHLSGRLEQRWRLDAEPVLRLGQVRIDNEPRFITRLAEAAALEGVEVRRGQLNLTADARIDSGPVGWSIDLPSSGWALPLDAVATRLHLPPGWDLLAVDGVDNLPDTWLARWSLLDIFLVLIAGLAIGRLWGWHWGLIGLLTLVLIWQEPGAPRWVWLHVLVAAALLRVLPAESLDTTRRVFGWMRALLRLYYRAALLVLALIALPFLVTEMRDGLFPQLDRRGGGVFGMTGTGETAIQSMPTPSPAEDVYSTSRGRVKGADQAPDEPRSKVLSTISAKPLPTIDPDAQLQTGAGVPDWNWRSFMLSWSGPVPPEHRLRLWLLPPLAALLLAIARLMLVLLLGLRLANLLPAPKRETKQALVSVIGLALGSMLLLPPDAALAQIVDPSAETAAEQVPRPTAAGQATPGTVPATDRTGLAAFPPTELLDALKQRLLELPDCLPRCAEIPRLVLEASAKELRLLLAVDAAAPVALPVPGSRDDWSPTEVALDGAPLDELRRSDDGGLIAPIPVGRHLLLLSGPLPDVEQIDIPLPLQPRLVETVVDPAWQLEGVDASGRPGDQLRLLRQRPVDGEPALSDVGQTLSGEQAARPGPSMDRGILPPLLRVTRTLRFGLDWTVATEVRRLSPPAYPVTLRVPLIPGEAVTSPGMQVNAGRILVSLPPGRERMSWSSTLRPVDQLSLTAADDPRLSEEWRLEVSPLWHLDTSGVPPVQNLGAAAQWLPTWRPWPGEILALTLSRPVGVPGPTLTLDRSRYQVTPSRRGTEAMLELILRSSQGRRHRVMLPADAELTRLSVDGQQRPLALQGNALDLPLIPGSQQITLGWREPTRLQTAYRPALVDLGTPSVNAETEVQLGRSRWLLWTGGPGIGPAVLFWGLVVLLALVAALLARSRLTPLGFVDWLLLGIGLSQVNVWAGALVALWLFALGLRRRLGTEEGAPWRFNLAQVGLVLLSVAALMALLVAVQQGLLGSPEMQIAGNGSSATSLNWYLDRQGPQTVQVTVLSAPIWVYRALMLAWALWLAWRLLGWLRWGWQGFAEPTLWRESQPREKTGRKASVRKDEALKLDI